MNTQTVPSRINANTSDEGLGVPPQAGSGSTLQSAEDGRISAAIPHAEPLCAIVQSRMNYMHVPEFVASLWYTDHNGRRTCMEPEERIAIERSGKCSLQRYATEDPYQPPAQAAELLRAMDARIGGVESGVRPIHYERPPKLSAQRETKAYDVVWHLRSEQWNYRTRCGATAWKSSIFGPKMFAHTKDHQRICKTCLAAFNKDLSMGLVA